MIDAIAAFAVVAALLTVVPGLDTAIVLRSTLTHGLRHGYAASLGVNTGSLVWGITAAAGVSALLTASELAYDVLRYVGAAYMVWLGLRLLVRALRRRPADEVPTEPPPARLLVSFRQGLLTNLLNPKIGAFYVAVLPQFLPRGESPVLVGSLMALVHDLEGLLWFSLVILGARGVGRLLQRPGSRRVVDGVSGVAIAGFGARLALARH